MRFKKESPILQEISLELREFPGKHPTPECDLTEGNGAFRNEGVNKKWKVRVYSEEKKKGT
jgi:hypothetical protein